jgi:hypothetical protein
MAVRVQANITELQNAKHHVVFLPVDTLPTEEQDQAPLASEDEELEPPEPPLPAPTGAQNAPNGGRLT